MDRRTRSGGAPARVLEETERGAQGPDRTPEQPAEPATQPGALPEEPPAHGAREPAAPATLPPGRSPSAVTIPDRRYFRIGDVAELLGVKPHVLRYWESEFAEVRPAKSRKGHRLYRRRDVELLAAIQRLVHQERYTIAGAREQLRGLLAEDPIDSGPGTSDGGLGRLERIRQGLSDLVAFIERRERDRSE